MFNRVAGSGAARREGSLAINRSEMSMNGMHTEDQLFRNLSIGQALCHQAKHLNLTRCQPIWRCGGKGYNLHPSTREEVFFLHDFAAWLQRNKVSGCQGIASPPCCF